MTTPVAPMGARAEARRATPVKWWAGAGAAFIVLQLYVYGAWIASGPERTDPGPVAQPWYMDIGVAFMNVLMPISAVGILFLYVVRPWWRDRRLSEDGILVLALIAVAWQDPLANYTQITATYNANMWNFGSWGSQVPGWMSPRAELITEPIMAWVAAYIVTGFLIVLFTCRVMVRAADRWPRIGTFGLISVAFALNFVLGIFSEIFAVKIGLYAYGGAIREVSLFPGTHAQLPIYETVLNAFLLGGFACVRFFKNSRGENLAERGIGDLSVTPKRRTGIRFLALVGALNTIFLVYNVGWAWFALHSDAWPEDLIERPYLTDGVCGPGTEYACPGPDVPIPRPDSGHLDPDGEFVPADSAR